MLICLQFPCLPSGLASEGNHHLYSVFLFLLPFIRKLLSPLRIGALMRMLYYFYVWTSEINVYDCIMHHSELSTTCFFCSIFLSSYHTGA
ncbi:Os03g0198200 [Oryza sativa Japonica Group]|uniref:Os03g0198200 protein n=2 Tax=Oryza sativa subsp. japonica TaxID=39947 RepID=A0A0P0VUF8_ORYSJ|nr:hypothetical protein OsJ_09783 [Oryza sativa Japonica Group]KAB8090651.1 hypothetical protein EE612_015917 [Oryza sativa]BAF11190.1 Os03g0198200 [Oryza sativa Japonica Group]BAS82790.1 Os03g0198200 [Oryza sativa Japonica Group]|eukprot:NP_001049276.1 Os03g0198200 [Oryza sativa Japonica Group]